MQSVIQKKSYGSVKVLWVNKKSLMSKLKKAVKILTKQDSNIEKIIIFGSVAEGRETPRSDIDIIIIVEESEHSFLDRTMKYYDYFSEIGLPADIFVYTKSESQQKNIPLLMTALQNGEIIFEKHKKRNKYGDHIKITK